MIIIDSREKYPLNFEIYDIPVTHKKLNTGDYTFTGLEDKVFIERKRTVCELALNFGKDWTRFQKELERTRTYRDRFIICEFPTIEIDKYPNCDCVPKHLRKFLKLSSKFIYKRIEDIRNEYDITFFFCSSSTHAEQIIIDLYGTIKE